jgi:proteasome activator subunit 3 (PA28 gamma)
MADAKKVLEYKDSLKKEAEELLLNGFTTTMVKLNALLETLQLKNRRFADVHQDLNILVPDPILLNSHTDLPLAKEVKYDNSISQDGTKVMILPSGSVPTNKHLVELVESVKPHIGKLV